jgi:hypothetical protein
MKKKQKELSPLEWKELQDKTRAVLERYRCIDCGSLLEEAVARRQAYRGVKHTFRCKRCECLHWWGMESAFKSGKIFYSVMEELFPEMYTKMESTFRECLSVEKSRIKTGISQPTSDTQTLNIPEKPRIPSLPVFPKAVQREIDELFEGGPEAIGAYPHDTFRDILADLGDSASKETKKAIRDIWHFYNPKEEKHDAS